jgi:hypothetical protein
MAVYHIFFIHSLVKELFQSLAVVNGIAINMVVQVSVLYPDFPDLCSIGLYTQ